MPRRPVIVLVLAIIAVAVLGPALLLVVQRAGTTAVPANAPIPELSMAATSPPASSGGPADPTADHAWWRIDPRPALLVVGSERARNGDIPVSAAYYVVDLVTGEALRVPELGEVFIQG